MGVDPEISRLLITEELAQIQALGGSYGWEVTPNLDALTVTVQMFSTKDKEEYQVEAKCDDYNALPPFFEFIHPITKARAEKSCYPADGSFFIDVPCLCVQWNRKAYKPHGGPHADWTMSDWKQYRPGTTNLADMFLKIQLLINGSTYKGRMQ